MTDQAVLSKQAQDTKAREATEKQDRLKEHDRLREQAQRTLQEAVAQAEGLSQTLDKLGAISQEGQRLVPYRTRSELGTPWQQEDSLQGLRRNLQRRLLIPELRLPLPSREAVESL
jgi:hypothetical protein